MGKSQMTGLIKRRSGAAQLVRMSALVAGICVTAGYGASAGAQSITLYGAADSYVSFDSGGKGGSWQMGSGAGSTSRFGLTGTEDLGQGWQAGFRLESGFNLQNGTLQSANTPFNRESNLWLTSPDYGTLKFGRQFPTIFPLSSQVDPFALTKLSLFATIGYAASDLGGGATMIDSRVPNSVSYATPDFGGFSGQLLYGFSTATVSGSPAHFTGGLFQYDRGNLYAGLSYNTYRNDLSQRTDDLSAGFAYRIGGATVSGAWNQIVPKAAGGRIASSYILGATIPFRFQAIKLSLIERRVAGIHNNATGALFGYEYYLSKRTALYTRIAWIGNGGASAMTLDAAQAAPGRDVFVSAFGMTHRF